MGTAARFVILAAPRTGSNLLCTLLGSHGDVLCHHEVFNPNGVFYALPLRDTTFSLGTMADRARDPLAFLSRVWATDLGRRCVGFKMTRGQEQSVIDAVVADPAVRVIVVRRTNRIKTYVSERRAQLTGQWEAYDTATLVADRPLVHIAPDALWAHMAENDAFYAAVDAGLARVGKSALSVEYERLLQDGEHQRLLAFLGVAPRPLTATSVKQNPRDLRELIDNYDDLAVALRGTELEQALQDQGP